MPDDQDFEEFSDSTPFRDVARIIAALSTQDEVIAEQFRIIRSGEQVEEGRERKIIIDGEVPVGMNLDLVRFADKIHAKIWERVARANWRSFEEARAFVHGLALKSQIEWSGYYKSGTKPDDIPSHPREVYMEQGWSSWGDWLGTGKIANQFKEYLPLERAREFVRELNCNNKSEWADFCKSGNKPANIPSDPEKVYKRLKDWISWGDWLGTGSVAPSDREFRSFEKARSFVHALKLSSGNEWRLYCKSGKKPVDIPTNPNKVYSSQGWTGMGDWLGTGSIAPFNMKFRLFEEARSFVHSLKLANGDEWKAYCRSGKKPDDIPASPQNTYQDNGWLGMGDWLGTGIIATHLRKYRPFEEARAFARDLRLASGNEWRELCKAGKKPEDIPANPASIYKDNGWSGWGDWLGTGSIAPVNKELRLFHESKKFVHDLRFKNQASWKLYCKSGKKPQDIPVDPQQTYKGKGWAGWGDWLGTGSIAPFNKEFRPFSNARTYVHALKIKSQKEWSEYCQSGKKPEDIPASPSSTYKEKGWLGWGDWLGTGNIAAQQRVYRPFKKAMAFVHKLNLKSQREWSHYCKSGNKPNDIPANPYQTYKEEGWSGMGDWLGTGSIAPSDREFRSFEDARTFVRELNLKSQREWFEYCSSSKKPVDIPTRPDKTYKEKGWAGYGDWLRNKKQLNLNWKETD